MYIVCCSLLFVVCYSLFVIGCLPVRCCLSLVPGDGLCVGAVCVCSLLVVVRCSLFAACLGLFMLLCL